MFPDLFFFGRHVLTWGRFAAPGNELPSQTRGARAYKPAAVETGPVVSGPVLFWCGFCCSLVGV